MYYVDLNKYKNENVRDDYMSCIEHISDGLELQSLQCHSISELRRRIQNGKYNYVFTSIAEYIQHKEFMDSIKEQARIVVVVNSKEDISRISQGILIIPKPFHVFGVAAVLNGQNSVIPGSIISSDRRLFYAPDAKILAVDDVRMNLNVLRSLLQQYKITIDIAENGKAALEKIRHTHYDLIFMDHMMPEMDGVDTLHNIRSLPVPYSQSIPVVALTANAIGGAREMLLNEGFDDFIAKSIEHSAMERVLHKFLKHCIISPEQYNDTAAQIGALDISVCHTDSESEELVNTPKDNATDIFTELKKLSCIDAEAGLVYCGNDLQSYLEILNDFIHSGRKRLIQLDCEFQKEDFDSYKITVHSLKGMAATVGGVEVAELSKAMQQECESENYDAVRQNHVQLTQLLETLLRSLVDVLSVEEEVRSDIISDTQSKEAATSGQVGITDLLIQLKQAVSMFDQMQVLDLTEQLENKGKDNPSLQQLAQQLRSCMEQFDFMEAERILAETGGALK